MKKKGTTAILALILGVFGVHRFYLGQRLKGFLHLGLFFLTLIATVEEAMPIVFIPAIIGFIDAVLFFVMPKEDFDEKHNKNMNRYEEKYIAPKRFERKTSLRKTHIEAKPINTFKEAGMRKYDNYQIEEAIIDFRKALNANFKDAQVHYLIACCYSINEEVEKSLFHIDKAVDFGFIDFNKINASEALSFLRTDRRFQKFVENSYQIPRLQEQKMEEENLELKLPEEPDLLDQISELGKLYEKGVLTPEEFHSQKQKLMNKV